MKYRLNADGHDESQYLPRGYPPFNAFRAAKGDIITQEGKRGGIEYKALTWMPERYNAAHSTIITDDDLHICRKVERIALSAMAAIGTGGLKHFMLSGMDIAKLPESDPFVAILKGMKPYQSNALLWFICDDRNGGNMELATKMIGTICGAIQLAKKILEDCKEISHNAIVTSGEVCPEIGPANKTDGVF